MAKLIDTVTVETLFGARRFSLFQGDVCEADAELLALSTQAGVGKEPRGLVVDAFEAHFGHRLTADVLRPMLLTREAAGTYRAVLPGFTRFQEVLVVRIPGRYTVESEGEEPLEVYQRHVWSLFGSVAALELAGVELRRMAMPVLAGQRQYDPKAAMRILFDQANRWLERSRSMEEVGLYLLDPQHVEAWEDALNLAANRTVIRAERSRLLAALADDARDHAVALRALAPDLEAPLARLIPELGGRQLALHRVAAEGRHLAEHVVSRLCAEHQLQARGPLLADIELLVRAKKIAPWIGSYLHNLRVFGNDQVHVRSDEGYRPEAVVEEDLVALLSAIVRVLAFWRDHGTALRARSS